METLFISAVMVSRMVPRKLSAKMKCVQKRVFDLEILNPDAHLAKRVSKPGLRGMLVPAGYYLPGLAT